MGISKESKKFKAAGHTTEDKVSRVAIPSKAGTEENLD